MSWPGLDDALAVHLGAVRYTVLGRTLRPFTIFHRELLRLAGHPMDGTGLSLPQLEVAVRICALPIFAAKGLTAGAFMAQPPKRGLLSKLRQMLFILRWSRRVESEMALFSAYLEACCSTPDVMVEERDEAGTRRDAPPLLDMMIAFHGAGFQVEDFAGRWPAGLAEWVYTTLISQKAPVKFLSEEDKQYQAMLREEMARMEARKSEMKRTAPDRRQRLLREVTGKC